MKRAETFAIVLLLGVALALRLPGLNQRPMHTDEAVHAFKFAELIENGQYVYDPHDYHGPTLYYFTLPIACLSGQSTLGELTENTLRSVPVLLGTLIVLCVLALRSRIGWSPALLAATFLAISPAFTFYSRYYIQEILLVCFTAALLAVAGRYLRRPHWLMVAAAGVLWGFLFATKETAALMAIAMLLALAVVAAVRGLPDSARRPKFSHLLIAGSVALLTAALLLTNLFHNPGALIDGMLAYKYYVLKAGEPGTHAHPFYYYFQVLATTPLGPAGLNAEVLLVLLGIVSPLLVRRRTRTFWFLLIYTLSLTLIYCLLSYKTPWSLLSFLFGWILLAGYSGAELISRFQQPFLKWLIRSALATTMALLIWQNVNFNRLHSDSPLNPYAYAQPQQEILAIPETLEKLATVTAEGYDLPVEVIVPENDYWPLPWHLRRFGRVGWWDHVEPATPAAPVLVFTPDLEPQITRKLFELPPPGQKYLYLPAFDTPPQLRPGRPVWLYVRSDLWNRWQQTKPEQKQP